VLAKFFAIDFALPAFPVGAGRSTAHHDIFAQIQAPAPTNSTSTSFAVRAFLERSAMR
jgi:heterotetrameric sarcosine oxidase gamma subunit